MAPRQPLLPSFLYAPSSGASGGGRDAPPVVVAAAPSEPFGKIEMFSPAYYAAGAIGGAAACGFTHAAVTPLDVIKCNIQIPYTMMKFATYENIVEMTYKHLIPTPKDQCSKPLQLGVSFGSGYVAGVFCAAVSHPADNLVSFLNSSKGATVGEAVKNLGLLGLFTRGLPLRILMVGTLTGAQWMIYDSFKVMIGLPTTGGAPAHTVPIEGLGELKASA